VPTDPAIPGQQWTVSAWAKGVYVNGIAQVSLSWFNSAGSYVGNKASESLPQGNPTWTKLTVNADVPRNATGVVIHLKACGVTGTVWFANVQISVTPRGA
jgi:hypothetical protein